MISRIQLKNCLYWIVWNYNKSDNKKLIEDNFRFCICMEIFDYHLGGELDHEDIISLFEHYEQT